MKYTFITLFLFLSTSSFISAQISNDEINIHIHGDNLSFPNGDNGEIDVQEHIWRMLYDDVEKRKGSIIQDAPFDSNSDREVFDVNEGSSDPFTLRFDAWEHDVDPKFEYNEPGDDFPCLGGAEVTIDPLAYNPGAIKSFDVSCTSSSDQDARFRIFYRYTAGDTEDNPLNFGIIGNGNYTHRNRVGEVSYDFSTPANIAADLYYSNEKDNGVYTTAPEIFYVFQIDNGCKSVLFETLGEGDLVTRLANYSNDQVGTILATVNVNTEAELYLNSGTYAIIVEGNESEFFDLELTLSDPDPVDGGEISYGGFTDAYIGYNPPSFTNMSSPTGGDVYQWERNKNDNGYQPIDNADGLTYDIPTYTQHGNYKYRRKTSNDICAGVFDLSNEIEIDISDNLGHVSGYVRVDDGSTNGCNGGPISEASVTITNNDALAGGISAGSITLQKNTNAAGYFEFDDFYVGVDQATWTVVAEYQGHDIMPTSTALELSNSNPNETDLCFEDTESFVATGQVFHEYPDGTQCGMYGVEILLKESGNLIAFSETDANGDYSIAVPYTSDFVIEANYEDHTFQALPSMFIGSDINNVDIEDFTFRDLTINFTGGCEAIIGSLDIQLFDTISCNSQVISTGLFSGTASISLPAKRFKFQTVTYNSLPNPSVDFNNTFVKSQIETFFESENISFDLSEENVQLDLEYHSDPVLEIFNWPEPPSCVNEIVGADVPYGVITSSEARPITIKAWDFVPDIHSSLQTGCLLDTGYVFIEDQLRSLTADPVFDTLTIDSMPLVYIIEAGVPNIVKPFNKFVFFNLMTIDSTVVPHQRTAIAEGVRPRENTFTTVAPEIPEHILRDPPGDQSYASLLVGESITTSKGYSTSVGGGIELSYKATYEKEVDILDTKIFGEVGGSIGVSGSYQDMNSQEWTTEVISEYSTSANESPNSIGESADVFIGAASNVIYALSDVIQLNEASCQVVRTNEVIVNPDSFATTFVYTTNTIQNNIIPSLRELSELSADPKDKRKYDEQIAIWEEKLEYNSDLKENAAFQRNISYGSGTSQSYTESMSSTKSRTEEWTQNVDIGVFLEAGFSISGIGATGNVDVRVNIETTQDTSTATENTFETSYTLEDNDDDGAGDLFSVNVLTDEVYAVPVFDVSAAETSCPYEKGTLPRHDATLVAIPSTQFDVPAEDGANFTLILSNVSQTGETMSYFIDYNSASNFDGADVSYNEVYESNRIELAFGESFTFTGITVLPNESNGVYTYEGIEFRVFAACLDGGNEYVPDQSRDIASVLLNVYFTPPCSDITLVTPEDQWISSTTINDQLPIHFKDYDFGSITNLKLQYKKSGNPSWLTGDVYDINSFNPNNTVGTYVDWNTNLIDEGEYKIRLSLECGGDIISTLPMTGVIDKTPPRKIGYPKPANRKLESADDIIGITFSEDIDENIDFNNISLINEVTGNTVDFDFSVLGNSIVMIPLIDLTQLPNALYRITYTDIADLYGNIIVEPITWTFQVGEVSQFTCDENTIFYVDKSATNGKLSGLSWDDAFINITDAMAIACPDSKIFVAEGTYYPTDYLYPFDSDMLDTIPGDEHYFNWNRSYSLYGGFPIGGSDFEARNPSLYPTIISGDANKDGINNAGDAHHVMKIERYVEGRMEGFILERVYGDASIGLQFTGAAIYSEGNVEMVNCVVRHNTVSASGSPRGGGFFRLRGTPSIVNCLFYDNHVNSRGGAIYEGSLSSGYSNIVNCVFYNNSAPFGSAIFTNGDDTNISNSIFYDNPGIDVRGSSSADLNIAYSSLDENSLHFSVDDEGGNILDNNPMFTDPTNYDFRLNNMSNCKDEGSNAMIESFTDLDLDMKKRITNIGLSNDAHVDMGAYEIVPCSDVSTQTILYVDQSISSSGDGYSWSSAYDDLSTALLKAQLCGLDTIHVAAGFYLPSTDGYSDDRLASFIIPDGIFLSGGYPSGGGTQNIAQNHTILSGNIGSLNSFSDNAYHVVTIGTMHSPIVIEGFLIVDGNANEPGHFEGGGILHIAEGYTSQSRPLIRDCEIKYNKAALGGGIANIGNNLGDASLVLERCRVAYNTASLHGGGVYDNAANEGISKMQINNSLIVNNRAVTSGGGLYASAESSSQVQTTIRNTTIANNYCGSAGSGDGAGVTLQQSANGIVGSKIYNSIIYGNKDEAGEASQIWQPEQNAIVAIKNSNIEGGYGNADMMKYNYDTLPYFVGAHIGDYNLDRCSPLIDAGDDAYLSGNLDFNNNPRKVGIIDIGSSEYDGFSKRGALPETIDEVVLNCIKTAKIPLPTDGITYALYNDTLTLLLGGPDVGDSPDKFLESTIPIQNDTTMSVVVGRDGSFGIDFENSSGFLEIDNSDNYNINTHSPFRIEVRFKPNSTSSWGVLMEKDGNFLLSHEPDGTMVLSDPAFSVFTILEADIQLDEWNSVVIESYPIATMQSMITLHNNGEIKERKVMNGLFTDTNSSVKVGLGVAGFPNLECELDYLYFSTDSDSKFQLDFISASGSDTAYDMSMSMSGITDTNAALMGLDRYNVWVAGEDSYVKLCPDTLTLNVILDPETRIHFVENHLDDGYKSLRQTVYDACPNDTIRFANILMGDTIKFESEILLDRHLFIEGLGMNGGTTLDGQGFTRLFNTQVNKSITYKDLQMINGYHPFTGGATPVSSNCTLWNVRFKDNTSGGTSPHISTLPFSNLKIKGDVILNE